MTPEDWSRENAIHNTHNPDLSRREFKNILLETLPCWHEISWEESGPALVLRIHRSFVDETTIGPNAPIVLYLQESQNKGDFSGDLKGNFGFNKALKNRGEKNGFYEFAFEIPSIKEITDVNCDRCDGTGKEESFGKCLSCEGEGKVIKYNWNHADEISSSLYVLTLSLHLYGKDVPTTFPQLLTFRALCSQGNRALSGEISIPLKEWLASNPDESHLTKPISAMKTAYRKMFGQNIGIVREHSFDVRINNSGLIINCPGDACGIHPDNWYFRDAEGYRFGSHNVDTPAQQLTLLTGLASLHDIARKEISPSYSKP